MKEKIGHSLEFATIPYWIFIKILKFKVNTTNVGNVWFGFPKKRNLELIPVFMSWELLETRFILANFVLLVQMILTA